MHTSGSSCHTTAVDMIEWEWLVIFYPMDVFDVVYKVICPPPPISLERQLQVYDKHVHKLMMIYPRTK